MGFHRVQVKLNYHKSMMKFGLLHLVAANMVTWSLTIVLEASGAFMHLNAGSPHETHHPAYNLTGKVSSLLEVFLPGNILAVILGVDRTANRCSALLG